MAKQTVTALFVDRENANQAVLLLRRHAIPDRDVTISPEAAATAYAEEDPAHVKGFWGFLDRLFGGSTHQHTYAEGVRRGHVLVTAQVDEANVDEIVSILERYGSVDLDECESAWRAEGWSSSLATVPDGRAPIDASQPDLVDSASRTDTEAAAACVLSTASAVGAYRTSAALAGVVNSGRARIHSHAGAGQSEPPSTTAFIHASVVQRAKDMQVVGSDGQHVGVIDCVDGTAIKLKGTGPAADGPQHLIPASWVQTIDGQVTLKLPAAEVRSRWTAV